MSENGKQVYAAIAAVIGDLSKEGVAKDRKNASQGYNFRGIDDIYNALSKSLSKNLLVMLPRVLSRVAEERETKNGGRMGYVICEVEFDLVSGVDGSKHTVRTIGEGMDTADKATNKAMSAAYKYAALQVFCIPTEGDNDADQTTPVIEVQRPQPVTSNSRQATTQPAQTAPKPAADLHPGAAFLKDIGMSVGHLTIYKEEAAHLGFKPFDLAAIAKGQGVATPEDLDKYLDALALAKDNRDDINAKYGPAWWQIVATARAEGISDTAGLVDYLVGYDQQKAAS